MTSSSSWCVEAAYAGCKWWLTWVNGTPAASAAAAERPTAVPEPRHTLSCLSIFWREAEERSGIVWLRVVYCRMSISRPTQKRVSRPTRVRLYNESTRRSRTANSMPSRQTLRHVRHWSTSGRECVCVTVVRRLRSSRVHRPMPIAVGTDCERRRSHWLKTDVSHHCR